MFMVKLLDLFMCLYDTATTENYTAAIVGGVRCVEVTGPDSPSKRGRPAAAAGRPRFGPGQPRPKIPWASSRIFASPLSRFSVRKRPHLDEKCDHP